MVACGGAGGFADDGDADEHVAANSGGGGERRLGRPSLHLAQIIPWH